MIKRYAFRWLQQYGKGGRMRDGGKSRRYLSFRCIQLWQRDFEEKKQRGLVAVGVEGQR